MPKYQLLQQNQTLNKQNFKEILRGLHQEATRAPIVNMGDIKKTFDEIDINGYKAKLDYFINITKERLSPEQTQALAEFEGLTQQAARERMLSYWKDVLTTYCINRNQEITNLTRFLGDENQNRNVSLEDIKARILPLIKEDYRNLISTNVSKFLSNENIKNHFEDYLNYLDNNFSNEELIQIGNDVNNHKTRYDYSLEDECSKPKYDDETKEIINILKETRTLDNKPLSDKEILEYENALNYANKLLGEPLFDIKGFIAEKTQIDSAIGHEYNRNYNQRLEHMGFDPHTTERKRDSEIGNCIIALPDKTSELNFIRNNSKYELRDVTKAHIIEIIHTMQKLGFDKSGITGEQMTKVYGLNGLFSASLKYEEAIKNHDPKAAIYAKQVQEEDAKVSEALDLIKKYMPLDPDNVYAIPGNVDSVRTDGIPMKYRMDFGAISHLAAFNNIVNLIKDNNWDINDFVDNPMYYMRDLLDKNIRNTVNPIIANKNLTGVDLVVNMGRKDIDDNTNHVVFSLVRALEGIACFSNNKNDIADNYAKQKFFSDNIANAYLNMSTDRYRMVNGPKIDLTIINPNLTFDKLGIKYYDAKSLQIIKPKESFDEIRYLRKHTESVEDFKNRLDETILNYMKKEIELSAELKKPNALLLPARDYVEKAQVAALKYLIVNKNEKDTLAYQQLESFIRNKKEYVDNLINSIPENNKLAEYQIVKDVIDQPLNINGFNYRPSSVTDTNDYVDVLDGFDRYIRVAKARAKTNASDFINTDKNSISLIKKTYNSYIQAKREYDSEVKKIYGENYHGTIDNLQNEKIKNAFIKKNELLRDLEAYKKDNLEFVRENVEDATIPETFLNDRNLAFENNNFNDIPLFRNDKQEYEFFARRYLESKGLTEKKEEIVDVAELNSDHVEINKESEQAKLLGVSLKEINDKDYGEDIKFDEVDYILKNSRLPKDFKNQIDNTLLRYLEKYDSVKNDANKLNKLPPLSDVINLVQKTVFEYNMLVPSLDDRNQEFKKLNEFLIDGNRYLKNLVDDENSKLFADKKQMLQFKISDFDIKDYEINKYANTKNDFEKYYQAQIKNKNIPTEAKNAEMEINEKIQEKLEIFQEKLANYKEKLENYNNLFNNINKADNNLKNDLDEALRELNEYNKDDLDNAKNELYKIIDLAKFKANELYRKGLVSDDYVKMRMERLDKNDFTLPSMYEIDNMPKMDDYIMKKYPDDYRSLSNEDKKTVYETYRRSCESQRKEHILKKYLIEEGIADKHDDTNANSYQKYLDELADMFMKEHQAENAKNNSIIDNKEEIIIENKNNNIIDNKEEIIIDNKDNNIIDNNPDIEIEDEKDNKIIDLNESFTDIVKKRLDETIIDEEFEDLDDDEIDNDMDISFSRNNKN